MSVFDDADSNCIVVNSLPFLCCWKDPDSIYMGCNLAYLDVFKIKNEEQLIGKTDFEMPWNNTAERLILQDKSALNGELLLVSDVLPDLQGNKSTFLIKKGPLLFVQMLQVL